MQATPEASCCDSITSIPSYLLGKYFVSYAILPSLFMNRPAAQGYPTYNLTGQEITVRSREGHDLEGFQVLYPSSRKWVINFHGNGAFVHVTKPFLHQFAHDYQVNVVDINYRGTGRSGGGNPCCFQDIVNDGKALVEHLLARGIPREDISIIGHSLGGAVSLGVAKDYQLPAIIQNTFSSTMDMVEHFVSPQVEDYINNNVIIPPPLELLFRVTYFVLSFIENLITCEFIKAAINLKEIVKTIFFDTLLTATWILCCAPEEWSVTLRQQMQSDEGNLIVHIARSPRFQWLAQKLLSFTGWDVDNVAAWNALHAYKLAFVADNDEVIPLRASLGGRLIDQVIHLEPEARHATLGYHRVEYQQYFRVVLAHAG